MTDRVDITVHLSDAEALPGIAVALVKEIDRLRACRDRWHRRTMIARLRLALEQRDAGGWDGARAVAAANATFADRVEAYVERVIAATPGGVQGPDDPDAYCDPLASDEDEA